MRKWRRYISFTQLASLAAKVAGVTSVLTGLVFLFIEPALGTIILMFGLFFLHISDDSVLQEIKDWHSKL